MPRVQVIVVREDRVLMVKHRHDGMEWWCLPGGAQEHDEIPERDRAFLWAAGLLGIRALQAEVDSWGNDTSYPGLRER